MVVVPGGMVDELAVTDDEEAESWFVLFSEFVRGKDDEVDGSAL